MSSSSSHDQRHVRSPPRRQRYRLPDVIGVPCLRIGEDWNAANEEEHNNSNKAAAAGGGGGTGTVVVDDWQWCFTRRVRRVRILVVAPPTSVPPPPQESPPVPSELLSVVVMGDPQSGKTSLVRRFIHRTTLHEFHNRKNSSGPQPHRKRQGTAHAWTMDYYRKDVAFWNTENTAKCIRIQLWDVGDCRTVDRSPQRHAEFIHLVQRTNAIILVVSLEHGLQHLLKTARAWKRWMLDSHIDDDGTRPVYWFLHKSDELPTNSPTPSSIQLGATIADVTRELGFASWHLTSCHTEDGYSIEEAMMMIIRSTNTNIRRADNTITPSLAPSSSSSTGSKTILSATAPVALHYAGA
jgi:hypothetical protein